MIGAIAVVDDHAVKAKVLITGAGGFVGRFVCKRLLHGGYGVRACGREAVRPPQVPAECEWVQVGELGPETDWATVLEGVRAVVHLAGRVHQLGERETRAAQQYRRINVDGTLHLAETAAAAGVQRFIFLSSVKVNGERTIRDKDDEWQRFSEKDTPHPVDAYGVSKWEAEQGLSHIAEGGHLAVTVLRPPLVYGPGVGANFLRLMRAVKRGVPLPLQSIVNLRSLIYVENLADAIATCLEKEAACNKTYLVSDVTISTPDLIYALAIALGCRPNLIYMPAWILRTIGVITFHYATVSRLLDSLAIDDARIRSDLHWTPPFTAQQGLEKTAAWFSECVGNIERKQSNTITP